MQKWFANGSLIPKAVAESVDSEDTNRASNCVYENPPRPKPSPAPSSRTARGRAKLVQETWRVSPNSLTEFLRALVGNITNA